MNTQLFLQRIKDEFPELKWNTYKILTHGWDHVVIVLDEKIIFRFPKDEDYKKEFKNEIVMLNYLKKRLTQDIPTYIFIAQDKTFAGYNMLAGKELSHSTYRRFTQHEKEIYTQQIAHFLSILHSTPQSYISKFNIQTDTPQKSYIQLQKNTHKLLFPRLNKKDTIIIKKYIEELKNILDKSIYNNVLIHNDLTWEHILWDKEKKHINIIDFSDRMYGDPASDFAGLWIYGKKFVNNVYKLYTSKKDGNLLYRSKLYFKRIAISTMNGALSGQPCTFEEGYNLFQKRFEIKKQ